MRLSKLREAILPAIIAIGSTCDGYEQKVDGSRAEIMNLDIGLPGALEEAEVKFASDEPTEKFYGVASEEVYGVQYEEVYSVGPAEKDNTCDEEEMPCGAAEIEASVNQVTPGFFTKIGDHKIYFGGHLATGYTNKPMGFNDLPGDSKNEKLKKLEAKAQRLKTEKERLTEEKRELRETYEKQKKMRRESKVKKDHKAKKKSSQKTTIAPEKMPFGDLAEYKGTLAPEFNFAESVKGASGTKPDETPRNGTMLEITHTFGGNTRVRVGSVFEKTFK